MSNLGFFVIVYSIFLFWGYGLPLTEFRADALLLVLLEWLPVVLVISGVGIMMRKKWSRYVAIIGMSYLAIYILYIDLMKNCKGDVGCFLWNTHIFFIFPLIVIGYLLIPKVKEQFS